MWYTKLEFTLRDNVQDNYRFRQAVSNLIEEFGQYYLAFQAEDLEEDTVYCEDASPEVAEKTLAEIFPES